MRISGSRSGGFDGHDVDPVAVGTHRLDRPYRNFDARIERTLITGRTHLVDHLLRHTDAGDVGVHEPAILALCSSRIPASTFTLNGRTASMNFLNWSG